MPRKNKKTMLGTTVAKIFDELIEKYMEQTGRKSFLRKPSKAQIVEDSILVFLATQGVLQQSLKSVGCSDAEVKSIEARLKMEYDIGLST